MSHLVSPYAYPFTVKGIRRKQVMEMEEMYLETGRTENIVKASGLRGPNDTKYQTGDMVLKT